ncbi:UspA domain-containing protein [Halobiforma nitratireducens JCM 10879]|uniref:UspA domain-containing protein n=1 Tax=Halobiforma nitratireducens JCM 10879 TaxID=1227454 RepID=M0L4P4_9EURY|nr:UspA domain-containing protein [Halobiforma nitratireducens JCM 10879]
MTLTFDATVVVPVADTDDSERTARAVAPSLTSTSTVIVANVIEKSGGALDKASMEQREKHAEEMFDRVRPSLEESPATLETGVL